MAGRLESSNYRGDRSVYHELDSLSDDYQCPECEILFHILKTQSADLLATFNDLATLGV